MPALSTGGAAGDLALVLHSHMPYVEGFGTYPFGEEWLFDAVLDSYLPLLHVVDRVTLTVTPVLADQLEDPGVQARMRSFIREGRLRWAEEDAGESGEVGVPAAAMAQELAGRADRLDALGGDLVAALRAAQDDGRVALMASGATHALLPQIATRAGLRLQLDAGLRSHRRRFGAVDGLWLPECAYRPGLDAALTEHGIRFTCVDQSRHEAARCALTPACTPTGLVAFTIDWDTVQRVWSFNGYPSNPTYLDFYRASLRGTRAWAIGGGPYDPRAAREQAGRDAAAFCAAVAERLRRHRQEQGRPGLCVVALDTELLGHWWHEGPWWLEGVIGSAPDHGVELVTLPEALERHPPQERPLHASTWGEGKDFRTWDAPSVADLAWAARRLELRLLSAVAARGLARPAAERAARELLAVQASDWAFLDSRGQAGDYPYTRAVGHGRRMLEAIESPAAIDSRLRNLAPDLSLGPLLEP